MANLLVHSPYDRSLLAELAWTSEAEVEAALSAAHSAYRDRGSWLSPAERIDILGRTRQLLEPRAEELALGIAREGGKPLVDARVEVRRALSGIDKAIAGVSQLSGREIPMNENPASMGRFAVTYREPRGVVLAVSAFNHPLNLLVHQAITAIAAGCPVLLKPSNATPLTAELLVRALHQAGLPPALCQLLLVPQEVTKKLVGDPRIAFLSFVGSAKVGWMLRAQLAPGATCGLEHGGVAPVIVDDTADLDDALPLLAKGAFYHAGQVCVSVQRIYVHESRARNVAEALAARATKLVVGDPTDERTEVGPMIRPDEVTRVGEWVAEATAGGAEICCGGRALGETTFAPTVLWQPPDDARVSTSEVFGPVVSVYSFRHLDEAIARANTGDSYFQAGLFTKRLDVALDASRRLEGMAVLVNDHSAFRVDWMPFGGHRLSGLGVGGIVESMRDMTVERLIVFRSLRG
jgi:acyl-CoA reductase-like NAD-dependent aldehyde dehydrogenase